MFDIVLYEPEIPPNTGNIMRLCANTGCRLHLIQPLGFSLDDKQLRRAGLDYREFADVRVHKTWQDFQGSHCARIFAITTKGEVSYHEPVYEENDAFVFGPETRGLPGEVLAQFSTASRLRIPMTENSRSLNLANAASILVYEAWRQTGFTGGY